VTGLLLASEGVNVNQMRDGGVTPLFFAAIFGFTALIKFLLALKGVKVKPGDM